MRVGVLHPGKMGVALASAVGGPVMWVSEGRSAATVARAGAVGLEDAGTLEVLANSVDVVISICPPAAALEVAQSVGRTDFDGIYVDANAVSPSTIHDIARIFTRFVDASVIGGPPDEQGETRLYLSGIEAVSVADLFSGSLFETRWLGDRPGAASSLKMAYAGWTKGTAALLLACASAAHADDVVDHLMAEWDLSVPGLTDRLKTTSLRIGEKAWRYVGEMEEIAGTLERVGLPPGFHVAAADVYRRLIHLKDLSDPPSLDEVLAAIRQEAE